MPLPREVPRRGTPYAYLDFFIKRPRRLRLNIDSVDYCSSHIFYQLWSWIGIRDSKITKEIYIQCVYSYVGERALYRKRLNPFQDALITIHI
jgi:hypothetical protein